MRQMVVQGKELTASEQLAEKQWEAVDEAIRQFPELRRLHRSAVADSLRLIIDKWTWAASRQGDIR